MALASLMRSACRSASVSPALSVAARFTPISAISVNRTCPLSNYSLLTCKSLVQQDNKRGIYTSPVRLSSHDHAKLWTIERGLSLALIPATPIAILYPSIATDVLMAVSLVMHAHWGLLAVVLDYVRPIDFGSIGPKIGMTAVFLMSVFCLVGLLKLIFDGPGLSNSLHHIWKL